MDRRDGQWRRSTRPPTSWCAQRMVPCRSRSQCSDVSCGQNYGYSGRPLSCPEPGATFISDCAAVLRGLERGPMWCSAARRPHADVWKRIWECFQVIGEEAHIDAVTKCTCPSQSKPNWTMLAPSRPQEMSGQTSWPKKERSKTPSSRSCTIRTKRPSKRGKPSSATSGASCPERKKGNDGKTWSRRLKDGTKRTSDGNVRRRFWRVPMN